jgi:hypothetical protein
VSDTRAIFLKAERKTPHSATVVSTTCVSEDDWGGERTRFPARRALDQQIVISAEPIGGTDLPRKGRRLLAS